MFPTLRDLIKLGKIGEKCLRRIYHCYQKINYRDSDVAHKILRSPEFQNIHGDQDHDYGVELFTLARCSFCSSCQVIYLQQVKDYHQELTKCLNDELAASARSRRDAECEAVPEIDLEHIMTYSETRKARRSCPVNRLEEYARQIKDMERKTNGFQRAITILKQELVDERRKHEQLEHKHAQMVDYANTEYGKAMAAGNAQAAELEEERRQHKNLKHQHTQMIRHGEAKYAELFNQAETRFTELMQKISGLESQNLWLQEQMQNQHTVDHRDMAMMAASIKELHAAIHYCRGQRCRVWLTPTTQHVINTLEPM